MGKKNNGYKVSYKLKVISFMEQFGNRAAQREFVRYCRKQKELLKHSKVGNFVGQKLENLHIFYTMTFQRPNYKKKVLILCE
jgi:hypothetical protein